MYKITLYKYLPKHLKSVKVFFKRILTPISNTFPKGILNF